MNSAGLPDDDLSAEVREGHARIQEVWDNTNPNLPVTLSPIEAALTAAFSNLGVVCLRHLLFSPDTPEYDVETATSVTIPFNSPRRSDSVKEAVAFCVATLLASKGVPIPHPSNLEAALEAHNITALCTTAVKDYLKNVAPLLSRYLDHLCRSPSSS